MIRPLYRENVNIKPCLSSVPILFSIVLLVCISHRERKKALNSPVVRDNTSYLAQGFQFPRTFMEIPLDPGRPIKHVSRKDIYTRLEARIDYLKDFLDFNSCMCFCLRSCEYQFPMNVSSNCFITR